VIEHMLADRPGGWRASIVGSQANDRWEIVGSNAFERSYNSQFKDAICYWRECAKSAFTGPPGLRAFHYMSRYIRARFLSLGCWQQLTTLQAKWF
jgi:hypothetical protein